MSVNGGIADVKSGAGSSRSIPLADIPIAKKKLSSESGLVAVLVDVELGGAVGVDVVHQFAARALRISSARPVTITLTALRNLSWNVDFKNTMYLPSS